MGVAMTEMVEMPTTYIAMSMSTMFVMTVLVIKIVILITINSSSRDLEDYVRGILIIAMAIVELIMSAAMTKVAISIVVFFWFMAMFVMNDIHRDDSGGDWIDDGEDDVRGSAPAAASDVKFLKNNVAACDAGCNDYNDGDDSDDYGSNYKWLSMSLVFMAEVLMMVNFLTT